MAWPAWVLVICVVVALVLMAYGALRAMTAARVVKNHVDRMKAQPLIGKLAKAQGDVQRINENVDAINALLVRANAAIRTMNDAIGEMRLPEAVAAIRTAGAAIRLLFNHT
ncbi:MAG TPA: hypothetical protein VFL13_05065 [Candidatus Baltobacteraceae bacterium]|nr:hypothetical protein [Candidatus Baltobacteraceae bacterium]